MNEVRVLTGPFIATDFEADRLSDKEKLPAYRLCITTCLLLQQASQFLFTACLFRFRGLSVIKFPDYRTQTLKVAKRPEKVAGLSGKFTDRLAKVTDCTVISPAESVCLQVQSGAPFLGQARYLIETGLFH